ncbi:MAG: [Fe-Fe] hydrogenase large subunit C-terminal domain-containing protein [Clostridiales bacterium]|nr:[Fe-Fe] hydrogenase large subunit C-terminal domain-containing protein [Clostridiales bacterium]
MENKYFHSVILKPERCIGCTYCLRVCPTEAIRLKNKKASIIAQRCIDCGECIRICPNHAKSAITDNIEDIKGKFKYNVALVLPVLYGQFDTIYSPDKILSAIKYLGFDDVYDISQGAEIIGAIAEDIIKNHSTKPVISSSCPAILRLIQVRFPELIPNILDIETPTEISARIIKNRISKEKGLDIKDIGITLITPCTARVTSIKNPIGVEHSFIDSSISIKDIYVPILKALSSGNVNETKHSMPTLNGIICNNSDDFSMFSSYRKSLSVNGIHNAISILEEIELGRLNNLSFIEIAACPGGCLGGPLVVENRYIALNNIKNIAKKLKNHVIDKSNINSYFEMYNNGSIRLVKSIEPRSVTRLDLDIKKSIKKLNLIQNILDKLPGINCGICGSPTCQAFAEDFVTGNRSDYICPVQEIERKKGLKEKNNMIVKDIMDRLNLKLAAGESGLKREIKDVYTCDLLSWVMAHADAKSAWVTIQTHVNIVAVAVLLDLSCIIIPENAEISDETKNKADDESIPLLISDENAYKICYELHQELIR